MAKEVKVSIIVDDNGSMRLTEKSAKKLGSGIDRVSKSATTADRALKGAAQASSNSTKNFSKMSQGITGGLVPAYATFAANVFAITAVFQAFKNAADVTNIIEGQKALGAVTGVAYGSITQSVRDATNGMLSFKEAASATAIGISSGLGAGQLEGLATAAKNASTVLGRDLTDSFNRLIRGVTKAEPELLDELGIILRLENASKKYADQLGIVGRDLTTFEKQQAVANDVLEQANSKYGKIAGIIDPAGQAINRLGASFDELLIPFQKGLVKLAPAFDFLSENLTSFTALLSIAGLSFAKAFLPAIPIMSELGGSVTDARDRVLSYGNANSKTFKKVISQGSFQLAQLKIIEKATMSKTSTVLLGSRQERKSVLRDVRIMIAAEKTRLAEATVGWTRYFRMIEAGYARATAANGKFLGTLKFGLAGVGKALNALPLIGLAFLAFDLGKQLYNSFFPLPEIIQKSNKAADELAKTTATVNEELERTVKIRKEVILSTQELAIQIGNVAKSSTILSRISAFEQLDKDTDPEKVAEAFKQLKQEMNSLIALDSRFEKFREQIDLLETGGSFTAKEEFSLLRSQIAEAGTALEKWPDTLKNIRDQIQQLVKVTPDNPFSSLTTSLSDAILEGQKGIAELEEQQKQSVAKIPEESAAASEKKTALEAEIADLDKRIKVKEDIMEGKGQGYQNRIKKQIGIIEAEKRSIESKITALDNKTESREKNRKESALALEDRKNELAQLKFLQTALINQAEKREEISKRKRSLESEDAANRTIGVTLDQKATNLAQDRANLESRTLDAKEKQLNAQANLNAIEEARRQKSTAFSEDEYKQAKDNLELADEQLTVVENRNKLESDLIALKETQIKFDRIRLNIAKQLNPLLVKERKASRELAFAQSGAGVGNFGKAQAQAVLDTNRALLQNKIDQAVVEENLSRKIWFQSLILRLKGQLGEAEYQTALKSYQLAQENTELANQNLNILNSGAQISLNNLFTETELLRQQEGLFNLRGRSLYVESELLKFKNNNVEATETQITAARTELETQYELKKVIENKKALVDSLYGSLQEGINGLIQGTMSFKDAFKNVALSVLKQLSQMIAQALTFKLLMGTSFGTSILGGLGNVGGSIPTGRNGGVFSQGSKVQGYSEGGVAKGSTSGYPAILHGTEAVVPLPDGKSIPVSMNGSGQNNNVTVNVSMSGEGQSSNNQGDSQQAMNIGKVIAGAVQEELQRQKRPGGILSPYGAA